jgi:hypothetical protein
MLGKLADWFWERLRWSPSRLARPSTKAPVGRAADRTAAED